MKTIFFVNRPCYPEIQSSSSSVTNLKQQRKKPTTKRKNEDLFSPITAQYSFKLTLNWIENVIHLFSSENLLQSFIACTFNVSFSYKDHIQFKVNHKTYFVKSGRKSKEMHFLRSDI